MRNEISIGLICAFVGGSVFAEQIELKSGEASCVLETRGARVLSYRTADCGETLWNMKPPQTEAEDWAHGGIAVCWPRFGRSADMTIHGFAWRRPFRLVRHTENEAIMRLETAEAVLTCCVTLSDAALALRLVTSNRSDRVFAFSAAFHPYFRLGERDRARLVGVKEKPLALDSALDGVIPLKADSCGKVCLVDPVIGRMLSLRVGNANGVCVWNPGAKKDCPGVIPGDDWRRFVCVEPVARPNGGLVSLAPGAEHVLSLEIKPSKEAK